MTESETGASPNSIRYFYTDPLAAAWMAKHFGMRFQALYCNEDDNRDLDTVDDILSSGHSVDLSIHPDSLHLLEPKDGDIGIWSEKWSGHRDEGKFTYSAIGFYASNQPYTSADYRPPMHTIIQRSGVAFHWPEREAA